MVNTQTMPRKKKEATALVRIDKDLARKARIMAAAIDMTLPDLLSKYLRPIIEREFPKFVQKQLDETGEA